MSKRETYECEAVPTENDERYGRYGTFPASFDIASMWRYQHPDGTQT